MSIEIRPAKASDMELCAALYKEIYNTVYQGIVDSRLITSINQEDTVQRMRGDWLQPGANSGLPRKCRRWENAPSWGSPADCRRRRFWAPSGWKSCS